ncbi:MAG: hypothetical protein IJV76_10655, partial [Clostridia bacterium]|nr:hypothetical protein [Clostridia bacterium]
MKKVSPEPLSKTFKRIKGTKLGADSAYEDSAKPTKSQKQTLCTHFVNPYRIKFFERGSGKT